MRSIAAGDISATQRPPSDAEALLRREVVDVGLRRVDRQAARADVASTEHERVVVGTGDPARVDGDRRSRSRCAVVAYASTPVSATNAGRRRARP